jgi:hypothetical protein
VAASAELVFATSITTADIVAVVAERAGVPATSVELVRAQQPI